MDDQSDAEVTAQLRLNGIPVENCTCRVEPHWSFADMEEALGRPLHPSDRVEVRVESPGMTSFMMANPPADNR